MTKRVQIWQGDLTTLQVDAIVNAANPTLLGGGGVDGAIHAAAGPQLLGECRQLGGCQPGQAKVTQGYNLPAKHVIHTVGPVWHGGGQGEAQLLASCYQTSLALANRLALHSIAFPAISTGVYGYPVRQAAQIACRTVIDFADNNELPEKIVLCTFSEQATQIFATALEASLPMQTSC